MAEGGEWCFERWREGLHEKITVLLREQSMVRGCVYREVAGWLLDSVGVLKP
jgi:hypothetical protein